MPTPPVVPRHLVGFVDTPATPSTAEDALGFASGEADGPLVAWGWSTIRVRYVVGRHGLDDRGGLKIVLRFPYDGGDWQTEHPAEPNFVRVEASRPCRFRSEFRAFGDARPWFRVFRVQVVGGCLAPGDVVTLTLGDRSGGGPGLRVQSFCEAAWELRLLVDPCATGHFREVPGTVAFPVVPGPAARWRVVLPGRRPEGAPVWVGLKAEDVGGNPTETGLVPVRLVARHSDPGAKVAGLPERVEAWTGRALRLDGVTAPPGVLRVEARHADTDALLAVSNPVVLGEDPSWWGDLHGQSGETVGINTADDWFAFGRDLSFLDACAHQANCFQINRAFWTALDGVVESWNDPGRYVTLPGYEWSGNTAVGGDRNVWFRRSGRPIRRASHALLTDLSDADTDAPTARDLFVALSEQEAPGDAVVAAHVGGRHADLAYAHDGRWERVVEVHSAWGTFEWLLLDALALGHRVGVVANSDGHKGRPGASYPGAATFGAVGGLTGWTAPELGRDALVDALRDRRTWATSGSRIDLDVEVRPLGATRRFVEDPLLDPQAASSPVATLPMGAIAATDAALARVRVRVRAPAGVLSVAVRVGAVTRVLHRPYAQTGRRARLTWEGAEYRGRGRQTSWDGEATLTGARLRRAEPVAAWGPESPLRVRPGGADTHLAWTAVTTGNLAGVDLWWAPEAGVTPRLRVSTGPARLEADLDALPPEGVVVDAGGLGRRLSLVPLPEEPLPADVDFEVDVDLLPVGDSPIWIAVTCEDGHQAWSSPVYLFPEESR